MHPQGKLCTGYEMDQKLATVSCPEICVDIAIRWEAYQWRAYNIGKPAINCSQDWSTGLGPLEVHEIFTLFSRSNLTFLPCK